MSISHPGVTEATRRVLPGLRNSRFLFNVIVVALGTVTAQLIGVALSPIISRLFTPSDFGIYGSFNAILAILGAGVTLQYTQAIVLAKTNDDAVNLLVVTWLSIGVIVVTLFATIVLAPNLCLKITGLPSLRMIALLLLGTVAVGVSQSIQAWCVRNKLFRRTSISQVIRSVSSTGMQITAGLNHGGSTGLILGSVCADVAATAYLCQSFAKRVSASFSVIRWRRVWANACEFKEFPFYATPQNIMNAVSQGLPVILLAHYYGVSIAGSYAFSVRVLQLPMNSVLTGVRQVLLQQASEAFNEGERLFPLYVRTTGALLLLVAGPAVILFLWSPTIFPWIFGTEWQTAGLFSRWIVLWLTASFCNVPSVLFGRILRLQRPMLVFDFLLLVARLLALTIGGWLMDPVRAIATYSLIGAVMNVILIGWIGREVNEAAPAF